MMKHQTKSRLLSAILAFVLAFTSLSLPTVAVADEGTETTATKITSMDELTTGEYVMVVNTGYAPTVLSSTWILAESVTVSDDNTIVNPASNLIWTITVDGTNAKLTDCNSTSIAPKGGNNNGIASGEYNWSVSCTDGLFTFSGQGEDTVVLASNKGSENNFRAYKSGTVSGNPNGYPSGFSLYKLSSGETTDPDPTPTPDPDPTPTPSAPLESGDQVVIYVPAYNKALSTVKTGNYNVGVDITISDNVMSGYGDTEIWTVIANDDGTYSFANGGQNIGMADSYASMNLGAVNDKWELIDLGNGLYNVKNTVRGNYMEWYNAYSNWSTYNSSSAATDGQFQIAFYVVPETPETPAGPLTNGDQVVVYVPAYNKALSTVKTGNYNAGVDVTISDNVMSGYGDTEIWTAIANDDGTYSFANGGQNIGMADSYASMNLGAVNDKWELIDLGNGLYNVKNTVRGNYMEWYNAYSNWSTYNASNVATDGQFQIAFYVIPKTPEIPDEPVTDALFKTGDKVVIYNPANMKALSTSYSGFYNSGVNVVISDGKLSGYTAEEIWTVGVKEDGTYTFSTSDGKKLSMGTSYTSMPLDDVNTTWSISAAATADCYYIENTARGAYIEYQPGYGTWSGYYTITDEALFAQMFYVVTELPTENDGLPAAGDQVVIYNLSAQGVLALQDDNADSPSITNALATIVDEKATAENGALIFKVEQNGDYYRFYNESYGYLCSNGTGNNAFYSLEASEDADWTLIAGKKGGYNMESRTAKYNGKYSQYLEYYAGAYKTYSMYNVTDYDIYEFMFYPCANEVSDITGGVVNVPAIHFGTLEDANVGMDYTLTFTVDAVFGVDGNGLTILLGKDSLTAEAADGIYTVVIPTEKITGDTLTVTVTGKDTKGIAISGQAEIKVLDQPVITDVAPGAASQTHDNLRPAISAKIINAGENPAITMEINGETVNAVYADGQIIYTPAADLAEGRTTVTITVTRADGKTASLSWAFITGSSQYQLYFGQLHSHTTYSDGSGSLESALEYVANLPESANVDFVAFTDHSNYFDGSSAGTTANPEGALYDMSLASETSQNLWNTYKSTIAAFNEKQSDIIAIGGFEMTWSGGPGHINTFNTAGIVSRNNTTLNNKTSDAGMKAYYALLSQTEGADSISQFNHPGSTFGTFSDFAYWDAVIDSRIYLVEVGNGEGQIGEGGYYPSYEYYTMALDKGWHVAPTNNQDNHKGKWGNANDARDVILTDDFSEEGIYAAIRALRMYSTEDKNLEITYTVNDLMMGSSITEVPEKLNVNITVYDPDASDSISKVELIVNSGKTAYTWDDPAVLASGELTATIDPTYSYYYVRVTQGDGDLAVTSPVWVGESLKLGISSVECGTSTPVTDEELTLTTTLFNSESSDAAIKALTYSVKGGEVLGTDLTGYTLPASGTLDVSFDYIPDSARVFTITVTAIVELDGEEYTFTKDIELDVQDASKLVYIGIDASHYNEYVNGNYKDSMGNFGELAAEYSVRTVTLYTSEDLIAACSNEQYKALILTAPSRRSSEAQASDPLKVYTEAELAAIKAFNANGGTVILAGWSDHYENYPDVASIKNMAPEEHMAATQNAILEALGSSLRIGDDATYDDQYNGGQAYRLYFNTYGDSFLTEGVEVDEENPHDRLYTEVFSHYGGASVYVVDSDGAATATIPATVSPVVFGHSGTYSVDVDNDGLGGNSMMKYVYAEGDERLMIMATEQLDGQGLIIVSGAAFMSNFEVQATIEDSGSEKNYSNYKICENLLAMINPATITDIAEVQKQTEVGYKYTIEGIVTSNASGYDKDTAFFDCIYVQDATGGICCFPVAGNYKIGDKVRVTGTTDFYQGEMELQVTSIEVLSEGNTVTAKEVTAAQINDGSVIGQLVTLKGTVVSYEKANDLIQTIMVKDNNGNIARIFIDGYITTAEDVKNLTVGCNITVTGCASYDDTFNAPEGPFPRIRVRNRADVICTAASGNNGGTPNPGTTKPGSSNNSGSSSSKPSNSKPATTTPTGDSNPIVLLLVLAAVSIVCIAFVVVRKKRGNTQE